jgi:hypothetical protein
MKKGQASDLSEIEFTPARDMLMIPLSSVEQAIVQTLMDHFPDEWMAEMKISEREARLIAADVAKLLSSQR